MRRRAGLAAVLTLGAALSVSMEGQADHLPYIDPDGAVVQGDWGLYRPGAAVPWTDGPVYFGTPRYGMGHYFPTNRNDAGAYRRPPKEGPAVPTQPYYRSWGAQSQNLDPNSASVYAPFAPPDVIYAPEVNVPGPRPRPHGH